MHSPDHSTKGTPSALSAPWAQWPLTAGAYGGSGSLSSPSRGAFHLSLTVLVHYRSPNVLSLGGWSPRLPTRFRVSRGTQDPRHPARSCLYGTLTRCGGSFQNLRVGACWTSPGPTTPVVRSEPLVWAPPRSLATTRGISVDFFSSGY